MSKRAKLTPEQIQEALANLPKWEAKSGKLHRTFQFSDFSEAWGFMCRVALIAEKRDHHPEWSNVYRTVNVDLSTHDAGGITLMDVEMAQSMNALAQ
jgi:4a-hydroxytetrahydrobiopterin dehydratase